MENFNIYDIPEMEDEELQQLVLHLEKQFLSKQQNFATTCYYVYKICKYYEEHKPLLSNKNKTTWYSAVTLLEKFGFDKTQVSRLKNCYERFVNVPSFIETENFYLLEKFFNYSPSKLYELLPLTDEAIDKCLEMGIVKSTMTVKEIRKIVKSLITGDKSTKLSSPDALKEEINEEEIPMVYDPTKEYDFDYFKSKTKNQLLNMIMSLQEAYIKLKQKKVK